MSKKDEGVDVQRRGFLKLASASVPAAALAGVASTEVAASELPVKKHAGLQMTDHVKAYLESARF